MKKKASETHPLIFVVGRPGSGKSTFVRFLLRALSHPDALALNDYSLLLQRLKSLGPNQISWTPEGQFEILDRSIFDELLQDLVATALANRDRRPVVVEFSRPDYPAALARFTELASNPPSIIYIESPLEACIQRNAARAPGYPLQVVPESVIRTHYQNDDPSPLAAAFPGRVRRLNNANHSLSLLEREATLLLSDLQGTAVPPAHSVVTIKKEITVVVLLLAFLGLFSTLAVVGWSAAEASPIARLAPTGGLALLKTLFLVVSGGGLGSTTYCIRALYHYYIRGMFDFDRFKWWYLFRPLTGAVLAGAAFAVVAGGSGALGTLRPAVSANLTWFGVSYLAGFGTEQVIEWLRRASKAAFGESRVQPDEQRPAA